LDIVERIVRLVAFDNVAVVRDGAWLRRDNAACLRRAYSKYDLSTQPAEDDEDYIDTGAAQLQFYSSLVDLLGRCAPEAEAIKAGRSDSLRARAILRSLVSLEDLEGALGLRFILPVKKMEQVRQTRRQSSSADPAR